MKNLIKETVALIDKYGTLNKTTNCKEILNHWFAFDPSKLEDISSSMHQRYAISKIESYKEAIELIKKRLLKDIHSRQAVVSFEISSEEPNCMLSIQIQVRNGMIYCTVYQRSLDVINKLPQDILIAQMICSEVEKVFRKCDKQITFFVGNAHYYMDQE